jgi:Domain of unknown function (DUF4403)
VSVDLSSVKQQILSNMPQGFSANDAKIEGGDYRYNFNLFVAHDDVSYVTPFTSASLHDNVPMGHPIKHVTHVGVPGQDGDDSNPKVTFINGRVYITGTYNGDLETLSAPPGAPIGCHLNPVYPVINIDFSPGVVEERDTFLIGANDINCNITLAPGTDTHCSIFQKDVRDELLKAFNGDSVKGQIISAIESIHKQIPTSSLYLPFQTSFDPVGEIFIYANPAEISVGNFAGNDFSKATFLFKCGCFPQVIIGTNPPPTPEPIKLNTGQIANDGGPVKIFVPIIAPYFAITEAMSNLYSTNALIHYGDKTIRMTNWFVSEANGRLLISIDLTNYVNGRIYFWGTPTIAADGTMLTVPDLQLDIKSAHLLDAIKIGLAQLFSGSFLDKAKQYSTIDLAPQIEAARTAISGNHSLPSGLVTLILNLNPEFAPGDSPVYLRPDAIVANILLQGSAQAVISGL